MVIDLLISLPVVALGLMLMLRCLEAWGFSGRFSRLFLSPVEGEAPFFQSVPLWKVFLGALGVRVAMLGAGIIAVMIFSQGGISWEDCIRRLCQRWDGHHYVNLVEQGYQAYQENGEHLFLAFFPGYVWAVRLLRLAIPNTLAAGVTLSWLSFGGACCFLYKLTEDYYDPKTARDALVYLCLFPWHYDDEGLFLFLTTGAWVRAKETLVAVCPVWSGSSPHQDDWRAGYRPGLAELLSQESVPLRHSPGAPLDKCFGPAALGFFSSAGNGNLSGVELCCGQGSLCLCDSPRALAPGVYVWSPRVIERIWHYFCENLDGSFGWATWFPALVMYLAGMALLWWASRRRENPPSMLVYGFGLFLSVYCLSWLLSAGRYLACCFPLFLFLARLTRDRSGWRTVLMTGEAMFLGIYYFGYISGAQIL